MKQKGCNKKAICDGHKHQVPSEERQSYVGEDRVLFDVRVQIGVDLRTFGDHLLGAPQDLVVRSGTDARLAFPVVAIVREGN